MIFISLGTHPQPFTRLVHEIARLVDTKSITQKVIIQTGTTEFIHPKIQTAKFFSIPEFEKYVKDADIFITHAGEGNIGTAMKFATPMIVVPRKEKFGEHTNDHQHEIADMVRDNHAGIVIEDVAELENAIKTISKGTKLSFRGYIPNVLQRIFNEYGIESRESPAKTKKYPIPKTATIIVATLNGGLPLIRAVNGMLAQKFTGKYDIVVVDDGSFDGKTPQLLKENFSKNKKVKLVFLPRSGVCKARNAGIRLATGEVVLNLDHDSIPEKDWVQTMVNGFDSPRVGIVSAYGHYGGTSTGFRKDLLDHVGGYDEDYFYYREDTDLSFKIMELGYEFKRVSGARYTEDRTLTKPKGFVNTFKYAIQRYKYHMNDVLLHQKHPTPLCEEMLHVHFGYFVNPIDDFKAATGLWNNSEKEMELSSPRGMTFLSNTGIVSFVLIVLVGMGYAMGMKLARLAGSIKHRHLLI